MTGNGNLNNAKRQKNDEFYTLISDIEQELKYYEKHFYGKIILCNCNDGEESAFWHYLSDHFERLRLKKLIAVKYGVPGYMLEKTNRSSYRKIPLRGNGDFRSEECINLLHEADVIITNPPFSLFREYIGLLLQFQKKFLIIGNMNMVVCNDIFPHIKSNQLWLGYNAVKCFMQSDGEISKFGNVLWYTNLECPRQDDMLNLHANYIPEKYPHYDNYPAIDVCRIADIPHDYYGIMGVPISYLTKHNPHQFSIIGLTQGGDGIAKHYENVVQHRLDGTVANGSKANTAAVFCLQDKPTQIYYTASNSDGYLICCYARVLIQQKQ